MKLLISPHNDDESLFCSFTLLREKPKLIVVFDSYKQDGGENRLMRRQETLQAAGYLGLVEPIRFLGLDDREPEDVIRQTLHDQFDHLEEEFQPEQVWVPAVEINGHPHHNLVGSIARQSNLSNAPITYYLTYTTVGKSKNGLAVPIEDPIWIVKKLKALACYKSQIYRTDNFEHFLRNQTEYYEDTLRLEAGAYVPEAWL